MYIGFRMASLISQVQNVIKLSLLLIPLTAFVQSGLSGRILQTNSGAVRGIELSTLDNVVDAYLGIPYALPPVGERRFRRPVPIPAWMNVYDAIMKPPPCYQNITGESYYFPKKDNMTEDCLYLNLWVPRSHMENTKLKAIMVYFHGGTFNSGSTDMDQYDGAILASYGNIIVASINSRIGAFGYFTASIEGANGNMAIYDQVLALKWINENAGVFGGDSDQITLFGQSSGAITVSGFMVSTYAQNLFKRGIVQSGAALIPFFFDAPKSQATVSNSLAVLTGCAGVNANITTDPKKVVSCLRSLPAYEISKAEGLIRMTSGITSFFPIYGDEVVPFETSEALRRLKFKGKDILMGINTDEGSFFLTAAFPQYFGTYGFGGIEKVGRSLAYSLISGIAKYLGGKNEKAIADYYTKGSNDYRKAIYDVLGDFLVSCSTILFADLYSLKAESVYFYVFTHMSSQKLSADWMGITHSAEIEYVFGVPLRKGSSYTEEEKELSRRIMSRFTAFAKTGTPDTPDGLRWPKYTYDNPTYLELNQEEAIKLRPDQRCEFWRDRFRANVDSLKPAEADL